MRYGLSGSFARGLGFLIAGLALFSMFCPVMAGAAVYDDFDGQGIDRHKWTPTGAGFSQPGDGYLHYSGTSLAADGKTPTNEKLVSKSLFKWGVFTMPFSDYRSDNTAPPAKGLGSVAALGLGSGDSGAWVRIERGQVVDFNYGYIEVNWSFRDSNGEWGDIHVNYVPSVVTSGELQLRYDGVHVTFYYRSSESEPWTQMMVTGAGGLPADEPPEPLVITPPWDAAVPLFIQAIPGGSVKTSSYNLSFEVDKVKVRTTATLGDVIEAVKGLDAGDFKKPSLQRAMVNKLNAVRRMLDARLYADAAHKLENDILKKTDGCSNGKGMYDRNDWITDCRAQDQVYPAIAEIVSLLKGLD